MRTRILLIGVLSLAAAGAAWWYANQQFDRLVLTMSVVVPAQSIPPYTLIGPDMLTTKDVPRTLASEPIYAEAAQVAGKISTVPLAPGMLLYQSFAVPPEQFRLVSDPSLEVVAFPVSPSAAVGGEVRAGQRINIYRAVVDPSRFTALAQAQQGLLDPVNLLAVNAAAVETLAGDVLVVAVQSGQGQRITESGSDAGSGSQPQPLQIITVAVSPATAAKIVRLVAEGKASVELWVSLAPLAGTIPTQ